LLASPLLDIKLKKLEELPTLLCNTFSKSLKLTVDHLKTLPSEIISKSMKLLVLPTPKKLVLIPMFGMLVQEDPMKIVENLETSKNVPFKSTLKHN